MWLPRQKELCLLPPFTKAYLTFIMGAHHEGERRHKEERAEREMREKRREREREEKREKLTSGHLR